MPEVTNQDHAESISYTSSADVALVREIRSIRWMPTLQIPPVPVLDGLNSGQSLSGSDDYAVRTGPRRSPHSQEPSRATCGSRASSPPRWRLHWCALHDLERDHARHKQITASKIERIGETGRHRAKARGGACTRALSPFRRRLIEGNPRLAPLRPNTTRSASHTTTSNCSRCGHVCVRAR
jgi:hypothetical protein